MIAAEQVVEITNMQKSVVITGGNRGIGRSLTQSFADAGYYVVVGARNDTDVEAIAPGRVRFIKSDVRSEHDHRRLVEAAVDKTGGLDAYVNNAGFSEWRPIEEIDEAFFDTMMNTNLKGAFWGCKAAAAAMKPGGTIINISSLAAKRGTANNSMYCASKFGMTGLTQSLAKELGPKGIRVNAVCPVLIRTDGLMEALETKWTPAKGDPEAFLEGFKAANCALGRLPTGNDVGALCLHLASDASSAITGQSINVDCGVLPQ